MVSSQKQQVVSSSNNNTSHNADSLEHNNTVPIVAENSTEETDQNSDNQEPPEVPGRGILILSDSIYKYIHKEKLAPSRRVDKMYVRGGTREMLEQIHTMPDDGGIVYNHIIVHTGTNDLAAFNANAICENIARIAVEAQRKWRDAKITISGITHRKDGRIINEIIDTINAQTRLTCQELGDVYYIDNTHITRRKDRSIDAEALYDDRHLSDKGIRKLAANLKKHLGLSGQRKSELTRRSSLTRSSNQGTISHQYYINSNSDNNGVSNYGYEIYNALRIITDWFNARVLNAR